MFSHDPPAPTATRDRCDYCARAAAAAGGGAVRHGCRAAGGGRGSRAAAPPEARRFGLIPLALLALAGCRSLAPDYERPPLPVASSYPADGALDGQRQSDIGWRHYFMDPGLRDLAERALRNNRDLRVAALRVAQARAAYGIQRSERFPSASVTAEGSRGRTPGDLTPTGQSVVSSSYQVAGVVGWELDFWGRVASLEESALQSFFATEAARRAFTVSVVGQVAQLWLQQRELDQRIDLAQAAVTTREESVRIFRRRYELGASSRLELMQVEALLTQAQALAAELEQARAANAHALSELVGEPVASAVQLGVLDGQGGLYPLEPGLPSALLVNRPDIMAAEHRLVAANAEIGAARAAFFPSIRLTGAYGTASDELDGLFAGGSRAWSYTPSISLPIFTAGRLRRQLELSVLRREEAVAQYEAAIQTAFREVADALSNRRWLAQRLEIRRAALATERERARLAQLRYDSGAVTFLEVLDARRELLLAEQAVVETQRLLLASQVDLFVALGGGGLGRTGDPVTASSNP